MDKERLKQMANDIGYQKWKAKNGSKYDSKFNEINTVIASVITPYLAEGDVLTCYLLSNALLRHYETIKMLMQEEFGTPPELSDDAAKIVRADVLERVKAHRERENET